MIHIYFSYISIIRNYFIFIILSIKCNSTPDKLLILVICSISQDESILLYIIFYIHLSGDELTLSKLVDLFIHTLTQFINLALISTVSLSTLIHKNV